MSNREEIQNLLVNILPQEIINLVIEELGKKERQENLVRRWSRWEEIVTLGEVMTVCMRIGDIEAFEWAKVKQVQLIREVHSRDSRTSRRWRIREVKPVPLQRVLGERRPPQGSP
jgi:hypothetical protein